MDLSRLIGGCLLTGLLSCCASSMYARSSNKLDEYNVKWNSPGHSDRDAIPMGNGEVAVSLWVEEDGDLRFYIARSDALSELDRNLKQGEVRIRFSPNPFARGQPFHEEMKLRMGVTEIVAGDHQNRVTLRVFVDALQPTVRVAGTFTSPTNITAIYQTWRNAPRSPTGESIQCRSEGQICESADIVRNSGKHIIFFHRNGPANIRSVAELEGLGDHLDAIPDDLTRRIFGGEITLKGSAPAADSQLAVQKTKRLDLRVTTDSDQEADTNRWIARLQTIHSTSPDPVVAAERTSNWWHSYWRNSWIFVEGDRQVQSAVTSSILDNLGNMPETPVTASAVTRAYILTKWMTACAERGRYPITFNGSLFNSMPGAGKSLSLETLADSLTAPPSGEPNLALNPDERPWGSMTLYQNLRLPYLSMLARGETSPMQVLFTYYRRFWGLNRLRAKIYYHAEGQYNTEITQSYGLQPVGVYGVDRRGVPVGRSENPWGGSVDISPGLELIAQMLDYYDYTGDASFLHEQILPYSHELFRYIETRFPARDHGRIVISPINAVETYWKTTNSMPIVAGMHAVLDRIIALPANEVVELSYFQHVKAITPDLPVELIGGDPVLAPASMYEPERHNVETPSLYAIFPFRIYGIGRPALQTAIDSYEHTLQVQKGFRPYMLGWNPGKGASYSGWQQTGMEAALLGLANDASTIVEENAALYNPGYRFPAMWGPIYDAVPDVDHGANLMNTLQLMAFQVDGARITVLPAWPKKWNVDFKFDAPHGTTVECIYRDGKFVKLNVSPVSRRKDVRVGTPQNVEDGNPGAREEEPQSASPPEMRKSELEAPVKTAEWLLE